MTTPLQTTPSPTGMPQYGDRVEAYLAADQVLLVHLGGGTILRVPKDRYETLLGQPLGEPRWRLKLGRMMPVLYWLMRFALLIAGLHGHR